MATGNYKDIQHSLEKGNITIKNVLGKIERTYLPAGTKIGKYSIIEEIDRGGMAVVYKATQLDLDRVVALKIMPANISITPGFLERFLAEAHSVAKLSHPNIVAIHEVSMEENIYFIVMDYIPGKNLFYYLNQNKPKLLDVLEITEQLAGALAYAHSQKIIHRDLKLNNVIMRDRHTPILIDFGLAKALENENADITRTGEIVGSPAYMAPERLLGNTVDHRSDICSLGIMLYEMLTFKNPYLDQRSIHQTALNVMESNPIPPRKLVAWLPPEVEAITLKALNADPTKRYQTMDEFRDDIQRYQRGEAVHAQPPSMRSRMRHLLKKYWPHLAIGIIALLSLGFFGVLYYVQNEKGKSHWQLVLQEKFSGREPGPEWYLDKKDDTDSAGFLIRDGMLTARGYDHSFARFERPFTRDIRLEVDMLAVDVDFYGAGIFLYGNSPDSGYAFHVRYKGTAESGMTLPGSTMLFYDAATADIPGGRELHIEIEKKQNIVSFRINGVLVVRRTDLFPPLGMGHQKIGFFTGGGPARFDNIKVFQRAIPASPSPTLIADRFFERGDFTAALEEYRALHIDFGNSDILRQIATKVPNCLIRLGRYPEAIEAIENIGTGRGREETSSPVALFLKARAFHAQGRNTAEDSLLLALAALWPMSPAVQTSAMELALRVNDQIAAGSLDSADGLLSTFSPFFTHFSDDFGRLHRQIFERYIARGMPDSALSVAHRISSLYGRSEAIVAWAHRDEGLALLCKGRNAEAAEVLNQCIATHIQSEGVWQAWMLLAAGYEMEQNMTDALTIYAKVWRECPRTLPVAWMARIRMGEIAVKGGATESSDSIFASVAHGDHPFPVPRLIARFYLGNTTESQFMEQWMRLRSGDKFYLYYCARRALLKQEKVVAKVYLQELGVSQQPGSWNSLLATRLQHSLDKW